MSDFSLALSLTLYERLTLALPQSRILGTAEKHATACRLVSRAVAGVSASEPAVRQILVRAEGLEPPRLSPPEPKSGVSTNSTTPAYDPLFPSTRLIAPAFAARHCIPCSRPGQSGKIWQADLKAPGAAP